MNSRNEPGRIPWMTTTVGNLPPGEQPIMQDLINMAMPVLWEVGGEKRFTTAKDGLHLVMSRRGANWWHLGEFRHESRTVLVDAAGIRAVTLNNWRQRVLGILAHELIHVRQFFRGPGVYRKSPFEFETQREYLNDPSEVEARCEEALVRKALGLQTKWKLGKSEKMRLSEYKDAFEVELLPFLREVNKLKDVGGDPQAGLPLSKRQVVEMLDDLTNYMSVRTIRRWDSRTQCVAARWWLLARGSMIRETLHVRSEAKKSAWMGNGMVQRSIRATLANQLPEAAERLKKELPNLTPMGLRKDWDIRDDTEHGVLAGLANLQSELDKQKA